DHDRNYVEDDFAKLLDGRLKQLGTLIHQGLIRLWLDLHRERVEERQPVLDDRRREHGEEALRQSLEILGELLVRRLLDDEDSEPDPADSAGSHPKRPRDPYAGLATEPSQFLRSIVIDRWIEGSENVAALTRRLDALGLAEGRAREAKRSLLHQVRIGDAELDTPSPSDEEVGELRHLLNREVRQLFGIETLAGYRDWPTRRPPRLTVFVIGDVGEPFVRTTLQPLLREIHAELLRSFGPILEYFREGFDRGLSVQPILWMPHPADAFEGGGDDACRCEEAAIINSVHRVRRWVESVVPPTRRRVSQIFVNSRVTDVAVLDLADAIRQTRDFLTLQIRNDLSRDEWLRQIAEGPPGDDYFASFTCYEIDFPAEKAREYLANRLARDFLRRLKSERSETLPEPPDHLLEPPQLGDQVAAARSRLSSVIEPAADRVEEIVQVRSEITPAQPRREVLADFDVAFEDHLLEQIQGEWAALSRERGGMDRLIDELRIRTSTLLGERVSAVRRHGDRLIENHAAEGGLQAAIAGFGEFGRLARQALEERDAERRDSEELARRHQVPETRNVETARSHVVAAAEARPEETPIRLGLALWLFLSTALGAPLAHALAYAFDLHLRPNRLEPLLGAWGWATGGALVALAGWLGVRAFQRRRHRRLLTAVGWLARTARRVLEGAGLEPQQEALPSVRSFLDTRLLLTEGVAARGFSLQIFERIEADHHLAARLNRSIDVQATRLARQVEDLGVRPTLNAGPEGKLAGNPENDDVRRLFAPRSGSIGERLIEPERLVDIYRRWAGEGGSEIERLVPRILAEAGG
ncbi:MAG TPA: hypothetical protein VKU40_03855, partial [Thermoanaerobaculia bacterium]|nr:hypothetical protein [Thermoanaerobaculia bacterium]